MAAIIKFPTNRVVKASTLDPITRFRKEFGYVVDYTENRQAIEINRAFETKFKELQQKQDPLPRAEPIPTSEYYYDPLCEQVIMDDNEFDEIIMDAIQIMNGFTEDECPLEILDVYDNDIL